MKSIFTLILLGLATFSSQNLAARHQPDCNHESLQEARERHQARH